MHPSVSPMPLLLQSLQSSYIWLGLLIILNCNFLLASNLLNSGARLNDFFTLALAGKLSACKLIAYETGHPEAALGFQASFLQDNILLNATNKKTDQSLS